ncbi:MAG: hypothetical protein M5T61_20430 [Acidimicrobiia bacterium]|nr:hypothetical protein [Acidimicrobiia bacterium]
MTNSDLTSLQVLDTYKSKQPAIERRHHLLKNVQAATPVCLKSVSRVEALLFLLFVALLVSALIERELRAAMAATGPSRCPSTPRSGTARRPRPPGSSRCSSRCSGACSARAVRWSSASSPS